MSAKEKTTGFLAEFRKFIARGNVMDLAVGVIIGGAFKGITDSLVNDILNPVLGIFAGDNEAPPRMLIAFLENNLQADGSVKIPAALRPYMGGKEVLTPKQ